jgi:hypothetical protein
MKLKTIVLLSLCLLLLAGRAYSQGGCPTNIKIETPSVPKPATTSLVSVNCSTMVVKWGGNAGQTYQVTGTTKDPATHQNTSTIPATNVTCDGSFNCTAAIPVEAGTTVNWSVQAQQEINGRNFYSYQLRAEQDYLITACAVPQTQPIRPLLNGEASRMFPNPVESFLTIEYKDMTKRDVSKKDIITITDLSGKTMMVKKVNPNSNQLNVGNLRSGLYLLKITDSNGKPLYNARFIKR